MNPMVEPMQIAVTVPCFNEEQTIAAVVTDFKEALPGATVYVYDNNSTDGTAEAARAAGAIVAKEARQGKGQVIRRMFADVDADIYVMVDGDGTYDASAAPRLIGQLIEERLDMVVGTRLINHADTAFRAGHRLGNRLLTGTVQLLFGRMFTDMLSGYRVFSRRFVKSFPALATGFETETELTIHALELRMAVGEVATAYGSRPDGSSSKLNTIRDGFRILLTIISLFKDHRPTAFFSIIFAVLFITSVLLGSPIVLEYLETGLVPRMPTAILATGIMLLAFLALTSGFILDSVIRGRREIKRLSYLSIAGPPREWSSVTPHQRWSRP